MLAVALLGVEWLSEPRDPNDHKDRNAARWVARMPRHWLVAWGDETWLAGEWEVREDHPRCGYVTVARGGGEKSAEAARLRAEAVYAALTHDLKRTT